MHIKTGERVSGKQGANGIERLIHTITAGISDLLWGLPMLSAVTGCGLFLSIKTRFFQLRRLGTALKAPLAGRKAAAVGEISPFEAACTALSATIGTGNIAGVAGAIALGGPGAVFWMLVSAILGMIIKLAETTLAVIYRERHGDEYVGGPMYYIKNGLPRGLAPLGTAFAVFGTAAAFGSGNAVQINTMTTAVRGMLPAFTAGGSFYLDLAVGMTAAILLGTVLLGGVKRIGAAAGRIVPLMLGLYIAMSLGVIGANLDRMPAALRMIAQGAYDPAAVTGGAVGSLMLSIRKGATRGMFTHEAGLGTSAMAHASAATDTPVRQGLYGVFETFVDTVVICTLTALTILCSGTDIPYGTAAGAELTLRCFESVYGGVARVILGISLCFFAFSSVVGWGLYGMRCIGYLLGEAASRPFLYCFCAVSIFGAVSGTGLVWSISEICNGMMALPNLTAVLLLSPRVSEAIRQFEGQERQRVFACKIPERLI